MHVLDGAESPVQFEHQDNGEFAFGGVIQQFSPLESVGQVIGGRVIDVFPIDFPALG
jgi:hypothetical protein